MANASPLLTSSLHSRNSASSVQESAYLAKAQVLQWSRLGLAVVVAASATAALGCAGHVLDRYDETGLHKEYHLPQLWPVNVDVRPTLAILIPAAIVIAVNVGYVVFSLIPTVRTVFRAFEQPRCRGWSTRWMDILTCVFLAALFAYLDVQLCLPGVVPRRVGSMHLRNTLQHFPDGSFGPPRSRLSSVVDVQVLGRCGKVQFGRQVPPDPRVLGQRHADPGRLQEVVQGEPGRSGPLGRSHGFGSRELCRRWCWYRAREEDGQGEKREVCGARED